MIGASIATNGKRGQNNFLTPVKVLDIVGKPIEVDPTETRKSHKMKDAKAKARFGGMNGREQGVASL